MSNNILPDLVPIPTGPFRMGSAPDDPVAEENEQPQHLVDLTAFQMSKYPITNEEYAHFIKETTYLPPVHWNGPTPPTNLYNHPVVNVNFIDANSYCDWLTNQSGIKFSPPSEEQWEKAARGGEPETRQYVWGSAWKPDACNTVETGLGETTAVHHFETLNRSPFGVVDILGNVWEWTSSYYNKFPGSHHDSLRYGISHHIVRGGSWKNGRHLARCSSRGRYLPGKKRPYLGFRIVSIINDSIPINTPELRHKIRNNFTLEEIQMLCYDLDIDSDEFIADTKEGFVLKLIVYCEHRNRLQALIELLEKKRPTISW